MHDGPFQSSNKFYAPAHGNIIFLSHVNSGVWAAKVVLCHKPLKMMFGEATSHRCQRLFMSVLQNVSKQQVLGSVWKCGDVLELMLSRWLIAGSV